MSPCKEQIIIDENENRFLTQQQYDFIAKSYIPEEIPTMLVMINRVNALEIEFWYIKNELGLTKSILKEKENKLIQIKNIWLSEYSNEAKLDIIRNILFT